MTPSSPAGRVAWRSAGVLLSLACVGWVMAGVLREADELHLAELSPLPLVGAAGLLLIAYIGRAAIWTMLLRRTGQNVPWGTGARVFLGSQLGRYVPGKVWQLGGAAWLGTRAGLAAAPCIVTTGLVVLLHNVVGAGLGLGALTRVGAAPGIAALAAVVLGGAALAGFAGGLSREAVRRLPARFGWGAQGMVMPSARDLLLAAAGLIGVWLLLGAALQLVSASGFADGRALGWGEAVSLMAASAVAGFVVLAAPAGLGVREVVLVAALLSSHTRAEAGVIALASRLLMTAVELGLAAWALWWPVTVAPRVGAREGEGPLGAGAGWARTSASSLRAARCRGSGPRR